MLSTSDLNGKQELCTKLRHDHDQARAQLVRATAEDGPIGQAAKWAAQIYLPHFKREERAIFPVLGLAPELGQGYVREEWVGFLPLISDLNARQDSVHIEEQWILSTVEDLLNTAHKEGNKELAELAYYLREHERVEHEVAYPAVMLIGDYLRRGLAV